MCEEKSAARQPTAREALKELNQRLEELEDRERAFRDTLTLRRAKSNRNGGVVLAATGLALLSLWVGVTVLRLEVKEREQAPLVGILGLSLIGAGSVLALGETRRLRRLLKEHKAPRETAANAVAEAMSFPSDVLEMDDETYEGIRESLQMARNDRWLGPRNRIVARLRAEMSQRQMWATIHLTLGVLVALVGAGILLYISVQAPKEYKSGWEALAYFLPRAGAAILVELLAYFFLDLHRSIMRDLKQLLMLLTSIEVRMTAAAWAREIRPEPTSTLGQVILRFAGEAGDTTDAREVANANAGSAQAVAEITKVALDQMLAAVKKGS